MTNGHTLSFLCQYQYPFQRPVVERDAAFGTFLSQGRLAEAIVSLQSAS